MKNLFLCLLLLALSLGFAAASAETTTLLVYMCGSDMADDAYEDLCEIADAQTGDDVTAVILAGGAASWDAEDLVDGSRNFLVIRDGYLEEAENWGRGSMGSPDTLSQFLRYGITNFPADRTVAILWNHGCGSEGGVCFDETANEDVLTLVEINEALQSLQQSLPGFHINVFGCDACMMATYEMAAILSAYPIDYYVASEETEPGTGWYYTGWLDQLARDPSMSDADLCAAIVDTFIEESTAGNPDEYVTLSAVSLAGVSALQESMEQFASVLAEQVQVGNLSAVRRGRSRLYAFGSFDDASWDMVDLGALLDTYAQFDPANAAEAKRLLSAAVIVNRQTDNIADCSGLSILLPQDTAADFDEYRDGLNLSGVIPNWMSFVNQYTAQLQSGSYHFTASDAGQISAGSEFTEPFVSSHADPAGCWIWDDNTGSYGETEPETYDIAVTDSAQGFTAVLPQDDLAYLDYVEGMLLIDFSDDDMEFYVDLGTMQNNLINWQTGTVVSLFDNTWPILGDQLVPLYDQSVNEQYRRSLIPVKLNGEYTYLVVVFTSGDPNGRIIGANAGYDANGLPIRSVTKLQPGDEIIPVYTAYYEEEGKEDLQDKEYDGSPFTWQEGMTVSYEDLSDDEDEPMTMLFCFVFNDIFGEDTMSDFIEFDV